MRNKRENLFALRDKLLRRLWCDYWAEFDRTVAEGKRLVFPAELQNMTCGARNRKNLPCKRTDLCRNGRCKFHGGLSTGPRTVEGKARSSQNRRGKRLKRTP